MFDVKQLYIGGAVMALAEFVTRRHHGRHSITEGD